MCLQMNPQIRMLMVFGAGAFERSLALDELMRVGLQDVICSCIQTGGET